MEEPPSGLSEAPKPGDVDCAQVVDEFGVRAELGTVDERVGMNIAGDIGGTEIDGYGSAANAVEDLLGHVTWHATHVLVAEAEAEMGIEIPFVPRGPSVRRMVFRVLTPASSE